MTRTFALIFLCGCTANNSLATNGDAGVDGGGEDLAMMSMVEDLANQSLPDLVKIASGPDDLAGSDFGGISCGAMSCTSAQICCVQRTGGVNATCVAPGGCPDGGTAAACDGPEDCMAGTPNCCATLSGSMMTGSGMAECTATCMGSLTIAGGLMVRTKLCHGDTDCAGYTGTFNGNSSAWDSCCHQSMGGPHFCANSGFAGFGGYTCP